MTDLSEIIAANVKHLRVLSGRSQSALAKAIGLHQTVISGIETRKHDVTVKNLQRIAAAFGVTPTDLITEPERCPTCGQWVVGVPDLDDPEAQQISEGDQ